MTGVWAWQRLQSAQGGTQITDWLPPDVTVATWPRPAADLAPLQRGNRFDKMVKPLAGAVRLSGVVWYQVLRKFACLCTRYFRKFACWYDKRNVHAVVYLSRRALQLSE